MGLVLKDDDWRIPDELWAELEPHLLVPETTHLLGCHRRRVPYRNAVNEILFVLNRFRRVLVRWEKQVDTFLSVLQLVCTVIVWRKLTQLG